MSNLPLKRDKRFKQGKYIPKNQDKFLGTEAVFRSGLELKFFRFCDNNPNVIKWGSENVKIQYYDTLKKKNRMYYIDNFVMIKEGDDVKKYLVEIKPYKQTQPPKESKRKKKSNLLYEKVQYKNNCDKWESAKKYAKRAGMEFIIITEKELNS